MMKLKAFLVIWILIGLASVAFAKGGGGGGGHGGGGHASSGHASSGHGTTQGARSSGGANVTVPRSAYTTTSGGSRCSSEKQNKGGC